MNYRPKRTNYRLGVEKWFKAFDLGLLFINELLKRDISFLSKIECIISREWGLERPNQSFYQVLLSCLNVSTNLHYSDKQGSKAYRLNGFANLYSTNSLLKLSQICIKLYVLWSTVEVQDKPDKTFCWRKSRFDSKKLEAVP